MIMKEQEDRLSASVIHSERKEIPLCCRRSTSCPDDDPSPSAYPLTLLIYFSCRSVCLLRFRSMGAMDGIMQPREAHPLLRAHFILSTRQFTYFSPRPATTASRAATVLRVGSSCPHPAKRSPSLLLRSRQWHRPSTLLWDRLLTRVVVSRISRRQ